MNITVYINKYLYIKNKPKLYEYARNYLQIRENGNITVQLINPPLKFLMLLLDGTAYARAAFIN